MFFLINKLKLNLVNNNNNNLFFKIIVKLDINLVYETSLFVGQGICFLINNQVKIKFGS